MDLEAEADEKNGWTRYNPDTPSSDIEEAANTLVAKRKYTRKVETEGV